MKLLYFDFDQVTTIKYLWLYSNTSISYTFYNENLCKLFKNWYELNENKLGNNLKISNIFADIKVINYRSWYTSILKKHLFHKSCGSKNRSYGLSFHIIDWRFYILQFIKKYFVLRHYIEFASRFCKWNVTINLIYIWYF